MDDHLWMDRWRDMNGLHIDKWIDLKSLVAGQNGEIDDSQIGDWWMEDSLADRPWMDGVNGGRMNE